MHGGNHVEDDAVHQESDDAWCGDTVKRTSAGKKYLEATESQ